MKLLITTLIISTLLTAQQNSIILNEILDKIHQQSQKHEQLKKSLGNYQYKQFIHFIKMDGDGDIEEQSKREYFIYVKSDTNRKRELLSAQNYEEGVWTKVTQNELEKSKEEKSESKSFSLSEMFSPDNRKLYQFDFIGEEYIDTLNTVHINATPFEEDEDKFKGQLWFETQDYNLIKAQLVPSDMPTFVDTMSMNFKMQKIDSLWFPQKIKFEAEVSVLFLFSGRIHSKISFSDFSFNQEFEESWFNKLESAD